MPSYRVDFKSRNPDQKRFHRAFTFAKADTPEGAATRVREVRPGEEVQIISVTPQD